MNAAGVMSHDVPLIGRDPELKAIVATFAESPCAAALIAGPAGVGKSRLAAEVAAAVGGTGRPVAHVIATEGAGEFPFSPFTSLLPDVTTVGGQPVELMQTLARAIADRARDGSPLLILVDDAHFLDGGSAALVHQLVLSRSCGVVVTMRTPDVVPDPILNLWKDGLAQRVEVGALTREESDALVTAYLDGPAAGSVLRWIWDVAAGNALFIRELLIGARESGALYSQDDIFFVRLPLPAPARLMDLIASRLASVTPQTSEVVHLLAVGGPLGFDELARLVGTESLDDAERRGLIAVHDDDQRVQVRLSHPLYREIVRQSIPRARLRRLSLTLVENVETRGARRQDDIMRIARWRLDSGAPGNPDLLEHAARVARAARDLPLAARLARAAMNAGAGVTAGLMLGETEFIAGRHQEAEKVFVGLEPLCTTDDERSLIAGARAYNLGILIGDQEGASRVVENALAVIVEPSARHRLLARHVVADCYAGRLSAAVTRGAELLESADEVAFRRGSYTSSIALALLGRTEEAVAIAYKALELHRRSLRENEGKSAPMDYQPPESQLIGAVMGHLLGGHLEMAESDARLGYERGLDMKDKEFQATFCIMLGWTLVERGLVAGAAKIFREGAAINRELNDLSVLRWCVGGIALAEAMAGRAVAASKAEQELAALPDHWMVAFDPHLVRRGHAWVLIASGHHSEAREALRAAAGDARKAEQFAAEAVLLHDLVRLGDAKEVVARLNDLCAVAEGVAVPAYAAHAKAHVTGDAAALEDVSTSFETSGAVLLAAESAFAAANAYDAAGNARAANAMMQRVARFQKLSGADRAPLLMQGPTTAPLTRREREIAILATSGSTSKAIAERLHLSARTVDNHLQNIYSKLGVTNRAALQATLRREGLIP